MICDRCKEEKERVYEIGDKIICPSCCTAKEVVTHYRNRVLDALDTHKGKEHDARISGWADRRRNKKRRK